MNRINITFIAACLATAGTAPAAPESALAQSSERVDWPATWSPETVIRVWFQRVGSDYEGMVWEAFRAWQLEEVALDVRPAASISEANLLVMEFEHPLDPTSWLGLTTIRGWGRTIENAVVRLSRVDNHGLPVPKALRKRTVLHEIGHVLGLGHGPEGRVMHGVSAADEVTAMDRADLGALYRSARGVADARSVEAEAPYRDGAPSLSVFRVPFDRSVGPTDLPNSPRPATTLTPPAT